MRPAGDTPAQTPTWPDSESPSASGRHAAHGRRLRRLDAYDTATIIKPPPPAAASGIARYGRIECPSKAPRWGLVLCVGGAVLAQAPLSRRRPSTRLPQCSSPGTAAAAAVTCCCHPHLLQRVAVTSSSPDGICHQQNGKNELAHPWGGRRGEADWQDVCPGTGPSS